MKKIIRPAIVLAAVFGAAVIVRRIRNSHVSADTADTTSTTQPEPQTPASTTHAPSDDFGDGLRVIGRIDLSQFRPDRAHRRVRIGGHPILEPERRDENHVCTHSAQPVVKPTVKSAEKHGRRSPLDGKESGNWQMPRVQESAMILLRGVGAPDKEISDAVGLSIRSVSRRLRGITPYPSSCQSIAA